MKYTFKDFITGKIKFTRGEFKGWTDNTGLVGSRYAIFRNRGGDVLVPAYLLTAETKEAIKLKAVA